MSVPVLLPAVDIAGGVAAQVVGDADRDPLTVALGWVRAGARWVHLVDLDRARGRGDNLALLQDLVPRVPVPVQLSGGVEDAAGLDQALATGAARVNLASTALRDLAWVGRALADHGTRLAIGIDVLGQDVVARGVGTRIGSLDTVLSALRELPTATYVVADASRDGSLGGADTDLFRRVASALGAPVIASGGVAGTADLRALAALGPGVLSGVVVGAALHHGTFTLQQGSAALAGGSTR